MTAAAPATSSASASWRQREAQGRTDLAPNPVTGLGARAGVGVPHDGVAEAQLAAVRALPRRTFHRGDALYARHMPATAAYIIETGLVALTLGPLADRERVVAIVGPSDVIGKVVPNLAEYQDGAVALSSEVTVRPIAETDQHEFAWLLEAAACAHIVRLTNALEDAALPVPARVALAVMRLGDKFGQRTANGNTRLTLPITHDTLAAMVGAARETTTSTIQQLRAQGLLQGTRGSYQYEPESLASYADRHAATAR